MYELTTNDFKFRIIKSEIYEEDIQTNAENTLLTVQIVSSGFSAISTFDLDIASVAYFAKDLTNLYENLSGTAEIHDLAFGTPYIEFTANQRGYIHVKGKLIDGSMVNHKHEMIFENEFEQTYLREFAYSLLEEYKTYLS